MTQPEPAPDAPPPSPRRRRGLGGLVIDPTPLRLDRDYRLLWSGQAISATGRFITQVVLPYQVYVLTGRPPGGRPALDRPAHPDPRLLARRRGRGRRRRPAEAPARHAARAHGLLGRPRRPGAHAQPAAVRAVRGRVRRGGSRVGRPAGPRELDRAPRATRAPAGGDLAQPGRVQRERGHRTGHRRDHPRDARDRGGVHGGRHHVPRGDRRAAADAPDPADAGRRTREHPEHPRGPPVRAQPPRAAGDVHRRHQRDGVRVAARPVPGARARRVQGGTGGRRVHGLGGGRRRARRGPALGLDRPDRAGRGARS